MLILIFFKNKIKKKTFLLIQESTHAPALVKSLVELSVHIHDYIKKIIYLFLNFSLASETYLILKNYFCFFNFKIY